MNMSPVLFSVISELSVFKYGKEKRKEKDIISFVQISMLEF